MTRAPIDYTMIWAATYAAAWHHEYLRHLETTDAADKHRDALEHGREGQSTLLHRCAAMLC